MNIVIFSACLVHFLVMSLSSMHLHSLHYSACHLRFRNHNIHPTAKVFIAPHLHCHHFFFATLTACKHICLNSFTVIFCCLFQFAIVDCLTIFFKQNILLYAVHQMCLQIEEKGVTLMYTCHMICTYCPCWCQNCSHCLNVARFSCISTAETFPIHADF